MQIATQIDQAAQWLAQARRLLVLTGAGISAESGIPTFREAQTGLWARFSPHELATPEAFAAHPERVWAWYRWRRTLIAKGGINAGHRAIAELGKRLAVSIATQNVDGLHGAAGLEHIADIAELHGNIWHERCVACAHEIALEIAWNENENENGSLPVCERCGQPMRPAVVWFGEMLPQTALTRAQTMLTAADCVLVVGSSNQVYPAASLVEMAIASVIPVIEINPVPTGASSSVDLHIAATASTALPALVARLDAVRRTG